jgi:hypothetical protein
MMLQCVRPMVRKEGDRCGERDEELHGVHAADGDADVVAAHDEVGGDDRPPAAAAHGIDKRAEETERCEVRGHIARRHTREGFGDDHDAHDDEVAGTQGLSNSPSMEESSIGANDGADNRGNEQTPKQKAIHIAKRMMREA